MNASARERVKELLTRAERLSPEMRRAFIDQAARDDPSVAHEALDLLSALDSTEFMSAPTVSGLPPTVMPAAAEQAGARIGRYKLLQLIGEGGFGAVFMAEQTEPVVRRVALKIIKAGMDTKQVIARFEAERQAFALMDHPNIARVLDAGAADSGRPYFVMELVRGDPVTTYCDRERLSLEPRLELFRDICGAVQHAHQKGIIHRDLKPSNVLVTIADGRPLPKVIDFGIAKATAGRLTDKTLFTELHQLIGTPEYMSPEQAEVSGVDVDTRSDIYSLGVLLYELLAGTTPLDSRHLRSLPFIEIQRLIREEEPPRPSLRLATLVASSGRVGSQKPANAAGNPADSSAIEIARRRSAEPVSLVGALRGDLDWIVMKCLEKDRCRRYATAGALADDVEHFLAHRPVCACPPSPGYKFRKFARRNRTAVIAASIVIAALLAGIAGTSAGLIWALRESTRANGAAQTAQSAERIARTSLVDAYLAQARASRASNRPGRRFDALEALRAAAAISPSRALRDEAIACMALCDVRLEKSFPRPAGNFGIGFSSDLRRLAIGTPHGEIMILSTDDGRELFRLSGPDLEVRVLIFSEDGRYLGTKYHTDRTIQVWLWDLAARHPVIRTDAPGVAGAVCISPDGRWAAIGRGERVQLYSLPSGEPWKTLDGMRGLNYISAHPDADWLALCGAGSPRASVWSVQSGESLVSIDAPEMLYSLSWSHAGDELAGACADESVYVWDARTAVLKRKFVGHQSAVQHVGFAPRCDLLVSSAWDSVTRVWNPRTGEQNIGPIIGFTFFHTVHGQRFTGTTTNAAQIWDFEPADECRRFVVPSRQKGGGSVAAGLRNRLVATTGAAGLRLWDMLTGAELAVLTPEAWSALFLPDDSGLTALTKEGLRYWPLSIKQEVVRIGESRLWPLRGLESASLGPDGRSAIFGNAQKLVIFDLLDWRERLVLPGYPGIARFSASPDFRRLITGVTQPHNPSAKLWDLEKCEIVKEFPGPWTHGTFSPCGRWLLMSCTGQSGPEYQFYDVGTWRLSHAVSRPEPLGNMAFTSDGRLSALRRTNFDVQLVETSSGNLLATLEAPDPEIITSLSFSPDDRFLAVGTQGRVNRVWDLLRIRRRLAELGLDWAPESGDPAPSDTVETHPAQPESPLRIE